MKKQTRRKLSALAGAGKAGSGKELSWVIVPLAGVTMLHYVLFCLQNRGGCEAVSGPHPWRYSSTGLSQDVEEASVFSTDMFYEEAGLFQLLNSEILIFFYFVFSFHCVYSWYKVPCYRGILHVSLYCSLTIFSTIPFSFPFIRPLFL